MNPLIVASHTTSPSAQTVPIINHQLEKVHKQIIEEVLSRREGCHGPIVICEDLFVQDICQCHSLISSKINR